MRRVLRNSNQASAPRCRTYLFGALGLVAQMSTALSLSLSLSRCLGEFMATRGVAQKPFKGYVARIRNATTKSPESLEADGADMSTRECEAACFLDARGVTWDCDISSQEAFRLQYNQDDDVVAKSFRIYFASVLVLEPAWMSNEEKLAKASDLKMMFRAVANSMEGPQEKLEEALSHLTKGACHRLKFQKPSGATRSRPWRSTPNGAKLGAGEGGGGGGAQRRWL